MKYFFITIIFFSFTCKQYSQFPIQENEINWYLTKADSTALIQKQNTLINWTNSLNINILILMYPNNQLQFLNFNKTQMIHYDSNKG